MPTDDLMERLLESTDGADMLDVIDALHVLLDDSTIEPDAPAKTITEAAALVGLSPHTLRYYETEGLLTPDRTGTGHREYGPDHLRRHARPMCHESALPQAWVGRCRLLGKCGDDNP